MNKTILSLLGAAMLYACGSTPAQTTASPLEVTPQPIHQEAPVAQEPPVATEAPVQQYVTNFPTEERGDLTIRQCPMDGYTLISFERLPTDSTFDQASYPETLVSRFDSNGDLQPDMVTFRYIHPQHPFASGPYLYIRVQHRDDQSTEVMTISDYRHDCLNGNEQQMIRRIDPQQQQRRQHRQLPPGARLRVSLDLESHL